MIEAIEEGLMERKIDKDKRSDEEGVDSDNSGEGRAYDIDEEEDPELKRLAKVKADEEGDGMKRPRKPAAGGNRGPCSQTSWWWCSKEEILTLKRESNGKYNCCRCKQTAPNDRRRYDGLQKRTQRK